VICFVSDGKGRSNLRLAEDENNLFPPHTSKCRNELMLNNFSTARSACDPITP
jgi:hypothetical protein